MHLPQAQFAGLATALAMVLFAQTAGMVAAQSPTPAPQPAISGAGISAGETRTFAGVTIVHRVAGDVTITLAEGVLTVTSTVGAPFVLAPGTGVGCTVNAVGGITTARCPAPPGTALTLSADTRAAAPTSPIAALPRTGAGAAVDSPGAPVAVAGAMALGLGVVVGAAVLLPLVIRHRFSSAARAIDSHRG